ADRGVIEAIENATGKRIVLLPGQYVTEAMLRWIDTVRFSQPVNIQDWYGLKGAELAFNQSHQTGLGVTFPGGALPNALHVAGRDSPEQFAQPQLKLNSLLRSAVQGAIPGLNSGNVNLAPFLRGQQLFGPRIRSEG